MNTHGNLVRLCLFTLLAAGTIFQAPAANACDCMELGPLDQELAASAAVFTGKVTSLNNLSDSPTCRQLSRKGGARGGSDETIPFCGLAISMDVESSWKGPSVPTLTVYTPVLEASCGFDFVVGTRYVVFARRLKGGQLFTSQCGRTSNLSTAMSLVSSLGVPKWKRPA